MNALYLTIKPIYPAIDGGCVAMSSFLKHLLAIYDHVDHLTIATYKHPFELQNYPSEQKLSIDSEYVNTKISPIDAFKNLFSKDSYNIIRFYSKSFENKLIKTLKNNYSVIYIESVFLLPYLATIRANSTAKVILRAPNIEFEIWKNYAQRAENPFKKWYLNLLTKKLKNFEIKQFDLVDGILTITNHDASIIQHLGCKKPILNLPFSLTSEQIRPIKKNSFFFLGALNWQPNVDAVIYLIKTVFPEIKSKYPEAQLHIAGSYTPPYLYDLQNESVTIHGKVESVKEFMIEYGILLSPIFSGSGVRIKILEALSLGIPVIGSKIAIQGIQSKACFIAENEHEYVTNIERLNKINLTDIQLEATQYIAENYHPSKIEAQLNEFIKNC